MRISDWSSDVCSSDLLVLHAHSALRAEQAVLLQNRRGQSGLWGQAISGDHPIVLVQIADAENIELVRQMVQAYAYWRLKGLPTDLVIWNDEQGGYPQQLPDQTKGRPRTEERRHGKSGVRPIRTRK